MDREMEKHVSIKVSSQTTIIDRVVKAEIEKGGKSKGTKRKMDTAGGKKQR